jgi:transcriptional regulator with XRE-family HTH domain
LEQAIRAYGKTYSLARASGLYHSVLSWFIKGERGLHLKTVDRLCEFFGMRLTKPRRVKDQSPHRKTVASLATPRRFDPSGLAGDEKEGRSTVTISEQLKRTIRGYGSNYAVARDTGVQEQVLSRFMNGKQGLYLTTVDQLCEFFGMRLSRPKRVKDRSPHRRS